MLFVMRTKVQQPCQKICLELLPCQPTQNDVPANDSGKPNEDEQGNADYQKQVADFIVLPGEVLQLEGKHRELGYQ